MVADLARHTDLGWRNEEVMAPHSRNGPDGSREVFDFAQAAPVIAHSLETAGLLPRPTPGTRRGDRRRYGSKGSLVIYVSGRYAGTWRDFEAGVGGGMLALIERYAGLGRRGALRWVRERGGLPAATSTPRKPNRTRPREDFRARTLLEASVAVPAAALPAQYWRSGLVHRAGYPSSLRWIRADILAQVRGVFAAPEAAGALLAPLAPLDAWLDSDTPIPPEAKAVHLIYLRPDGKPAVDAGGIGKRTYGRSRGCCWCVLGGGGRDRARLAEGIADVLALFACHGPAISSVGTSNSPRIAADAHRRGLDLTLHADGDTGGKQTATSVLEVAPSTQVLLHRPGSDPAAAWERSISRTHGETND